jgi:hypothetical protein
MTTITLHTSWQNPESETTYRYNVTLNNTEFRIGKILHTGFYENKSTTLKKSIVPNEIAGIKQLLDVEFKTNSFKEFVGSEKPESAVKNMLGSPDSFISTMHDYGNTLTQKGESSNHVVAFFNKMDPAEKQTIAKHKFNIA